MSICPSRDGILRANVITFSCLRAPFCGSNAVILQVSFCHFVGLSTVILQLVRRLFLGIHDFNLII